jgi:hypothetical protein
VGKSDSGFSSNILQLRNGALGAFCRFGAGWGRGWEGMAEALRVNLADCEEQWGEQ